MVLHDKNIDSKNIMATVHAVGIGLNINVISKPVEAIYYKCMRFIILSLRCFNL